MAPGAKFSTMTSARFTMFLTRSSPRSDLRLTVMDFLLALNNRKYQESRFWLWPGCRPNKERPASPPSGFSTLTTSAPSQASASVQDGPASNCVRSRTRTPARKAGNPPFVAIFSFLPSATSGATDVDVVDSSGLSAFGEIKRIAGSNDQQVRAVHRSKSGPLLSALGSKADVTRHTVPLAKSASSSKRTYAGRPRHVQCGGSAAVMSRNHRLRDLEGHALKCDIRQCLNPKALVRCGSQAEPVASLRNRRGAKYLIYLMAG